MNKNKLFHLTRRSSFLWKSALVLALVIIAIGTGVSFLNTERVNAFERVMASDVFEEDGFDQILPQEPNGEINAALREELASNHPFHEKLEVMQILLHLPVISGGLSIPGAEGLPNLSPEEYIVTKAFFNACLSSRADGSSKSGKAHVSDAVIALQTLAGEPIPLAHANYALSLIHGNEGDRVASSKALRREIEHHDSDPARERLVRSYLIGKRFDKLKELQMDPAFEPFINNDVLQKIALSEMDWLMLFKTLLPVAYEDANIAMICLALVAGFVWVTILLRFNGTLSFRSPAVQLAVPALILGALSAHATILAIFWQEHQFNIGMGETILSQIIYCVAGIGFREEALKLLFFIPLIPFLLRRKNDLEILTIAGLVGLGFAIEENINYFQSSAGLSVLGRFATANFLHISLTALCGLTLVRAFMHKGDATSQAAITFGLAVAAHGIYDAFIIVPVLQEYAFFSSAVFVLIGYQYFGWLRHLRDQWRDPVSITAHFTLGVILVTGTSYILYAWTSGAFLAFQAMGSEVLGLGIILILFYRGIPENIE